MQARNIASIFKPMQEKENKNIEEATERVKKRLPLEQIRCIPKYKNLSSEDYEKLIKNSETIALLILKAFLLKKQPKSYWLFY